MRHWFPDARQPKDIDILSPAKIVGNHGDVCVVEATWHPLAERVIAASENKVFADPSVLLTLKMSHAHWDIHHAKTLYDITFLRQRGASVLEGLYAELVKMWTTVHGKNLVTVDKPMAEFFRDAVPRAYDHEWLHEQLAFHDRPLHERIRKDMSNVRCDRALFEALSWDDQCKCALEEILVTAVERRNLTAQSLQSEKLSAVHLAHRKLCTTMATGWFARFNIEHNHHLLIERKHQWLTHLNSRLKNLPPPTPGAFYKPSSSAATRRRSSACTAEITMTSTPT